MPMRPNSSLRKTRKCYFGWKDGDSYYLSIYPKEMGLARNEYASAIDAVKDANSRHLAIVWEDPSVI